MSSIQAKVTEVAASVLRFYEKAKTRIQMFLSDAVSAVERFCYTAWRIFVRATKLSLISLGALLGLAIFLVFAAIVFVSLCILLAASTRYFFLRNLPGSAVLPVSYNALPLLTERWRLETIDTAIQSYLSVGQPCFLPHNEHSRSGRSGAPFHPRSDLPLTADTLAVSGAADLKLSLLRHFTESMVATSTLFLPAPASAGPVFTTSGAVNYDAIFSKPTNSLFTMNGEYSASLQLVFLKEDVGVDTSLVLEYAVLFSNTAEDWSLPSLNVLFHSTRTTNIRTGPKQRWLLGSLFRMSYEFIFYVPLRVLRFLHYSTLEFENAPFPHIDQHREVAVVVPLYDHFTPPVPLRHHLRAINFTLYQQFGAESETKVRLSRWMFHSSVKLHGFPYWLQKYPKSSFLVLTCFYAFLCGLGLLVLIGGVSFYVLSIRQHNDEYYSSSATEESRTTPNRWSSEEARATPDHDPLPPAGAEVHNETDEDESECRSEEDSPTGQPRDDTACEPVNAPEDATRGRSFGSDDPTSFFP